jgi:hypothetical protein
MLWTTALLLYAGVVMQSAGVSVAVIATLGAAGLALWGTPLVWISGSQDLWMLCFSMLCLLLFISGRRALSAAALAGALLSKETAAVVPLIALGYCVTVERRKVRDAIWQCRFLLLTVVVWLLVHPTLLSRTERSTDPAHSAPVMVIVRSLLATVNLDPLPAPRDLDSTTILMWWLAAGILAACAMLLLAGKSLSMTRKSPGSAVSGQASAYRSRAWMWGLWWGAAGYFAARAFTGWRAHYFGLGALSCGSRSPPGSRVPLGVVASPSRRPAGRGGQPSYEWSGRTSFAPGSC